MAGPNTTGTPNTQDYNLGRGKVYFALLDTNSKPLGFRDLGNAPEFKMSLESETLEHKSSRSGLKVVDKEVVISQKATLSMTLDEINHENLALFVSGAKAAYTNPAIAGITSRTLIAAANVELGRWFDIVDASGNRAYDIDATKLTVADTTVTPVVMTKDTDYTVDETMGRIFLISTSTKLATTISTTKAITIVLTADASAGVVSEVRGVTTTSLRGALKFVSQNPADSDKQTEYQFHQVSLKANGDLSLIGDEFTTLPLTGVAEANVNASATSPTLTIRNVA